MTSSSARDTQADRDQQLAMRLSLIIGCFMLAGKLTAYWLTGSAAILSDAIESVVHVAAVAFAAFSLWLSRRPAREASPFGYEKITFFSAGFEGGMISVAAFWIIAVVVEKWRAGLQFEDLGRGTLLTFAASLINLALGWYLVATGRRTKSLILEANGEHVLTDSWTSFGVVAGLGLVMLTGWKPFDPLIAIAVALNILWTAFGLVKRSVRGLLDLPDTETAHKLNTACHEIGAALGIGYHRLRFRDTGQRLIVGVHLLFQEEQTMRQAHRLATQFEEMLEAKMGIALEVESHLESAEDHDALHPGELPNWDH
ncbi:MAG: cation transporter [Acidobacteria bacterium]|nr:cation transporter [Acidobacteriota bacterium]